MMVIVNVWCSDSIKVKEIFLLAACILCGWCWCWAYNTRFMCFVYWELKRSTNKWEREQAHNEKLITKYKKRYQKNTLTHTPVDHSSRSRNLIDSLCIFRLIVRASKQKNTELIIIPALIFIFWLNSNSIRFCFPIHHQRIHHPFSAASSPNTTRRFLLLLLLFLLNSVLLTMQLKPHVHTAYDVQAGPLGIVINWMVRMGARE